MEMMSRRRFLGVGIWVCASALVGGCRGRAARIPAARQLSPGPAGPVPDRERAIAAARKLYRKLKAQGVDFSKGPCIAQEITPDWAVDIAHDPRRPIDNLAENQCASFLNGEVHHFVELDPNGKLIRAI